MLAPPGLVRSQGFARTIPGFDSNTSTQSPVPSACVPGGVNDAVPEFEKGEPAIDTNVPSVGSNHRATDGPLSRDRSTVTVRTVGRYAMTRLPSGVAAAVA